jgi:hypothetical protein
MSSQTITTPLTHNSNSVAIASFKDGNTTSIQFQTNGVSYWNPTVSANLVQSTLGSDQGNSQVTFKKGLTVKYLPKSSTSYSVTVTGQIVDNGTSYNLSGLNIGTFTA